VRKELQFPQNKALCPVVLTSLLGQAAEPEQVMNGYLEHGYSITQTSQVYLDNKVFETSKGMVIEWDYISELFECETIEQMQNDYYDLVIKLSLMDWQDVQPTLSLAQRDLEVIAEANNASRTPVGDTLISICEQGGIINPDAVAVIDEKGAHSYRAIMQMSHYLAGYLYEKQKREEELIAVLSEKRALQVIAVLGSIKAGKAYLPLNIDWPIGRINEVLVEGGVSRVLVSQTQYAQLIKSSDIFDKYQWIVLEDVITHSGGASASVALPVVNKDDIAYVIFTSGSTGKPKGVTISHEGAVNTILAVNERFAVSSEDNVLALSELSF
ncbi:hypothetical protein CWC05_19450, partial [Pseudoalteromonas ruthenica]